MACDYAFDILINIDCHDLGMNWLLLAQTFHMVAVQLGLHIDM